MRLFPRSARIVLLLLAGFELLLQLFDPLDYLGRGDKFLWGCSLLPGFPLPSATGGQRQDDRSQGYHQYEGDRCDGDGFGGLSGCCYSDAGYDVSQENLGLVQDELRSRVASLGRDFRRIESNVSGQVHAGLAGAPQGYPEWVTGEIQQYV